MQGNTVLSERQAFALRLFVGVAFGLAMAALAHAGAHDKSPHEAWRPIVYSILVLSAFIWWAGAGTMRRLSLGIWGAAITVLIALLSWHQTGYAPDIAFYAFTNPAAWLILPLLFIAHELTSSADQSGRWIAPYATYFDQAWKRGVQLGLSLLFTGLFWVILWLGAALLKMIGFHWFEDLLEKDWFALPACGAAMACAVQLGDVQDKLLSHVRAVVLSVLSWLLPVITAIGLLFLCSLCVSGLEPLWKTRAASVTLLGACIAFVLLINAAYQQGDAERPVNIVLKWAARLAAILLMAFAGLAAYSLWLRTAQYGLTPERVLAASDVIIAVLFGAGYGAASVMSGRWLWLVDRVNIAMAFVMVVIFLGLLTPVADPVRLGVADQVARLQSGRTPLAQFDWQLLRFATGSYGMTALSDLGKTGKTADIRAAAVKAAALKDEDRWNTTLTPAMPVAADDINRLKVVYPAGAKLPASVGGALLEKAGLGDCVHDGGKSCTAALIDLNGDGGAELIVRDGNSLTAFTTVAGAWTVLPPVTQYIDNDAVKAFDDGQLSVKPHGWSDLKLGNTTLTIEGNK